MPAVSGRILACLVLLIKRQGCFCPPTDGVLVLQGYSELKVPLSDIAVNPYTVSELVRLCLRKEDAGEGGSGMHEDEELEVVSFFLSF